MTALLASSCGSLKAPKQLSNLPVRYCNTQYGLAFFMPASWRGYSVSVQQWHEVQGGPEHGPLILLRHPRWSAGDLYQDIPILVFTRGQWESEKAGEFAIGAGGIEEEIGHTSEYVFAISSRFNANDDLKAWREATDAVEANQAANEPHLYPE